MYAQRTPLPVAPLAQSRHRIWPPVGAAKRGSRFQCESAQRNKGSPQCGLTPSGSPQEQPRTSPIATAFIKFHPFPNGIAVTKFDSVVIDGAFLLDFSRSLQHVRWLGVLNRWLGFTVGVFVPVVHQGEEAGRFVIGVERSDPHFADLSALWRLHYPSKRSPPTSVADGLKVIADFHKQFPEDTAFY